MDRTQINVALAAMITTLAETGSAPSGHLFAALQSVDAELYTIERYTFLVDVMKRGGLVQEDRHVLSLTSAGREMARRLDEHSAAVRAGAGR